MCMICPLGDPCPSLYILKGQSYKQSILFGTISCSLTVHADQSCAARLHLVGRATSDGAAHIGPRGYKGLYPTVLDPPVWSGEARPPWVACDDQPEERSRDLRPPRLGTTTPRSPGYTAPDAGAGDGDEAGERRRGVHECEWRCVWSEGGELRSRALLLCRLGGKHTDLRMRWPDHKQVQPTKHGDTCLTKCSPAAAQPTKQKKLDGPSLVVWQTKHIHTGLHTAVLG